MECWVVGGRLAGGRAAALHLSGGRIASVAGSAPRGAREIDASGLVLLPAFVDAHVHLSLAGEPAKVAAAELRGGIAAVLDLGIPERLLTTLPALAPLRIRFAGPLLTAPGGYPTRSWGADGYGRELATAAEARRAVAELAERGARFAKLAFDARYPLLAPDVALAASDEAHRRGLGVAAHALDAGAVKRALDAGADVLAHAPVALLPDVLVAELGRRRSWVISTMRAFGASVEGVRRLQQAGARIAYGTDLGNEGTAPGIDGEELALLASAGVDAIAAATRDAAELLGEADLGRLDAGAEASLVGVPEAALRDPRLLAAPRLVVIAGERR